MDAWRKIEEEFKKLRSQTLRGAMDILGKGRRVYLFRPRVQTTWVVHAFVLPLVSISHGLVYSVINKWDLDKRTDSNWENEGGMCTCQLENTYALRVFLLKFFVGISFHSLIFFVICSHFCVFDNFFHFDRRLRVSELPNCPSSCKNRFNCCFINITF